MMVGVRDGDEFALKSAFGSPGGRVGLKASSEDLLAR